MPPEPKRRIRAALDQIRSDPDEGIELRLELSGHRRMRVGNFRIVYRVARDIEIVAIGPRESIYEDVARLIRRVKEPGATYRVTRAGGSRGARSRA